MRKGSGTRQKNTLPRYSPKGRSGRLDWSRSRAAASQWGRHRRAGAVPKEVAAPRDPRVRSLSAPRPSLKRSGCSGDGTPVRIESRPRPKPSFFKGIGSSSRAFTWTRRKRILPGLTEVTDDLSVQASRMGICLSRRHDWAFHFGRPSPPSWELLWNERGGMRRKRWQSIASASMATRGMIGRARSAPPGFSGGTTTASWDIPTEPVWSLRMHGNVWEYCLDHGMPTMDGPAGRSAASRGPGERVLRRPGYSRSPQPAICRAAYRDALPQLSRLARSASASGSFGHGLRRRHEAPLDGTSTRRKYINGSTPATRSTRSSAICRGRIERCAASCGVHCARSHGVNCAPITPFC